MQELWDWANSLLDSSERTRKSNLLKCHYLQRLRCLLSYQQLKVRFLGKMQIRISESKNWFFVIWAKSKNGSWIHKIHTQVDSSCGSNPNADFWDSQSERFFFWKGFETSIFDKRFLEKKKNKNKKQKKKKEKNRYTTDAVHVCLLTEPMLVTPY